MTQPIEQQIKFKVDPAAQQRTMREIESVYARLDRADEQYSKLSNRVGLAGDFQSNLGALRGLADTAGLGGVGQGLGVAGEIGVLAEELPRLKTAIQNMPDVVSTAAAALGTTGAGFVGALGIGAVALGAVTLAVNAFNASIDAQKKALEGALSVQDRYYLAIANSTSAEVQQNIDNLTARNAALQQQMDETQGSIDATIQDAKDQFGSFWPTVIATGWTPYQTLMDQHKKLQAEYDTNAQEIGRYTQGLKINAFAANDARAAQEQYTQQLERFNAGILGFARDAVGIANETSLSSDQIKSRIADANTEMNYLKEAIQNLEAAGIRTSEELQPLYDRYNDLLDVYARLTNDVLPEVIRAEQMRESADDLLEANEAMVKAEAELAKLRMKEAELTAEMQREISKILSEITAERAKAEAEAAEDRLEAAEDFAEDMAEIDEDRAKTEKGARRKRDVLAAIEARETAKDQQDDTRKAYDKQLKEVQKGLDKQYKSITENAAKAAAAVDERYRRERQTLQQAQQQAQIDLINAANAQRVIQQQIYALNRQDAYNAGLQVGQAFAAGAVTGAGVGTGGSTTSTSSLNRQIDQRVDQRLASIFPQPTQF